MIRHDDHPPMALTGVRRSLEKAWTRSVYATMPAERIRLDARNDRGNFRIGSPPSKCGAPILGDHPERTGGHPSGSEASPKVRSAGEENGGGSGVASSEGSRRRGVEAPMQTRRGAAERSSGRTRRLGSSTPGRMIRCPFPLRAEILRLGDPKQLRVSLRVGRQEQLLRLVADVLEDRRDRVLGIRVANPDARGVRGVLELAEEPADPRLRSAFARRGDLDRRREQAGAEIRLELNRCDGTRHANGGGQLAIVNERPNAGVDARCRIELLRPQRDDLLPEILCQAKTRGTR